ncbi:PAAR-like domain-containing protein [Serratia microhaemolytica]|uniref:PAAR-like domain-containing protein n=1 Tax=Serratia microhaemolytica TaxID=2675110 RepID=UPI00139238A6|nr:PAAR-like domain-containing protein [Serratia microhaemolytica]
MSTHVYINNHEACSKSSNSASKAAFPDPCWSPPSPPAGPVVIPYPNSSKAADMAKGTTTVFIKRGMVAKEDRSYFSTSTGNEGATQAFNKGVATGKITGKTYFVNWSQNVKFEGCCIPRNMDLTTHNHGAQPANTATTVNQADMTSPKSCEERKKEMEDACGNNWVEKHCTGALQKKTSAHARAKSILKALNLPTGSKKEESLPLLSDEQTKLVDKNKCLTARRCQLVNYNSGDNSSRNGGCCPGQTGHHLIPRTMVEHCKYSHNKAPTVCVESTNQHFGSHKKIHDMMDKEMIVKLKQKLKVLLKLSAKLPDAKNGIELTMNETIESAVNSHLKTFKNSGCTDECVRSQLEKFYSEKQDKDKPICKPKIKLVNKSLNDVKNNFLASIKSAYKAT